jgi:hypothetical protein
MRHDKHQHPYTTFDNISLTHSPDLPSTVPKVSTGTNVSQPPIDISIKVP